MHPHRVRRHFNYSNVMSTLAVFLVVAGGTALAARDPVVKSTKDVAKQALKNRNIKKGNLRGNRFRADTITGAKINEDTLDVPRPTSLPPSGPAGGGLAGEYPNPTLAPNSVGTEQLTDNSVTSAKIADGNVGTADLADGSVSTAKIADDAVSDAKIADRAVRTPQLGRLTRRLSGFTTSVDPMMAGFASVSCNAGERAISGGGNWSIVTPTIQNLWIKASFPTLDLSGQPTGWAVEGENGSGTTRTLNAFVLCLET